MECKEYLQLKPKFLIFQAKQERKIKTTRPPYQKATLKAKSDAELVSKAVLAVKGETNADRPIGGVQEGFFEQPGGFLAIASSALDGYIQSQQQKAILELLDTPEMKQLSSEQMKPQISEMQAKRRKLAFEAVGGTTTPTALTATATATTTALGSTRTNPSCLLSSGTMDESD
jgi:hypothetical protein